MISEKELAIVAGNTTFLKGKRLFQNDCVQLQTNFKNQVTGLVAGNYYYRTAIYHENGNTPLI